MLFDSVKDIYDSPVFEELMFDDIEDEIEEEISMEAIDPDYIPNKGDIDDEDLFEDEDIPEEELEFGDEDLDEEDEELLRNAGGIDAEESYIPTMEGYLFNDVDNYVYTEEDLDASLDSLLSICTRTEEALEADDENDDIFEQPGKEACEEDDEYDDEDNEESYSGSGYGEKDLALEDDDEDDDDDEDPEED